MQIYSTDRRRNEKRRDCNIDRLSVLSRRLCAWIHLLHVFPIVSGRTGEYSLLLRAVQFSEFQQGVAFLLAANISFPDVFTFFSFFLFITR